MSEPNLPDQSVSKQCQLLSIKRIRRLMRLMGLMPISQKPGTSKAVKGHKIYPYPLRGLRVDRPSQVWCADIIYLPPPGRFAGQIACRAMLGGRPPAVVYWQRIETTNPDQQEQRVAQFTPVPVQKIGSSSS